MIKALDPKLNPTSTEIQMFKNQLAAKDKKITELEVYCLLIYVNSYSYVNSLLNSYLYVFVCMNDDLPSQKKCEQAELKDYEERLIVTAWYNKVNKISTPTSC